jgi:hypothetical protein
MQLIMSVTWIGKCNQRCRDHDRWVLQDRTSKSEDW